jgi:ribosomal protein L33
VDARKIKLESTAGTGHFYTTDKNKKDDAGTSSRLMNFDPDKSAQARVLQGSEADVGNRGADPGPKIRKGSLIATPSAFGCPRKGRAATHADSQPEKRPYAACFEDASGASSWAAMQTLSRRS